jgi:hypothetical protein
MRHNANTNNFNDLNHITVIPLPKHKPTSEEPNCDNVEEMMDSLNNENCPITHLVEKMMDSLGTEGSLITHFSGAYIKFTKVTTNIQQVTTTHSYLATSESLKSFFLLKALEKKTGKNLSQIMALASAPTFASTLASTLASISSSSSAPVINMQVLNILTFLTTRLIFWEENLAHLLAEMGERLATETNISQKRLIEMLSFSNTSITSLSRAKNSPIVALNSKAKSENNILHIAANSGNYEFIKAILNNNYSQFLPSLLVSSNSAGFTPLDLAVEKSKESKEISTSLINQQNCITLLREGLRNLNQTQVAATPPFPTQATTAGNGSQEPTITKNCLLVVVDPTGTGYTILPPANVPYNTTIRDIINTLPPSYFLSNTTMGSVQVPTSIPPFQRSHEQSQFAAAAVSSSSPNVPTHATMGSAQAPTSIPPFQRHPNTQTTHPEQSQFAAAAVSSSSRPNRPTHTTMGSVQVPTSIPPFQRSHEQSQFAAAAVSSSSPNVPTHATMGSAQAPTSIPPFQRHPNTQTTHPEQSQFAAAFSSFSRPKRTTYTTMGSAQAPTSIPPFQRPHERSQFAAAVSSSSRPKTVGSKRERDGETVQQPSPKKPRVMRKYAGSDVEATTAVPVSNVITSPSVRATNVLPTDATDEANPPLTPIVKVERSVTQHYPGQTSASGMEISH